MSQELVQKTANLIMKTFGFSVKSIALVGSASRKEPVPKDIDILLVTDELNSETIKDLRNKVSKEIDLLAFDVAEFMEQAIKGKPYVLSLIRDSHIIYDVGLLSTVKRLVEKQVLPHNTKAEIVETLLLSAATSLMEAKLLKARALLGACFNSLTCMLQALVASSEEKVLTPKELYEQIDPSTIDKSLFDSYKKLYELKKMVDTMDSIAPTISESIEDWIPKCEEFLSRVLIMARQKEI